MIVCHMDISTFINRPVHLAEKEPWPTTNYLRNVINSFSIRKMSCFIKKSPQKIPWGNGIVGGRKNTKNEEKLLKTGK